MRVIALLIAAGGLVAGGFLIAFAWAVRSGQFDDTTTPPLRILHDDRPLFIPVSDEPRHDEARS
jgi:cbb3-type cytochrome oxidase maturation protein